MSLDKAIVKSTSTLVILTLFVKLLGVIKQSVIANLYGTNVEMDLFFIATDFITEIGIVFFSALTINLVGMYIDVKKKCVESLESTCRLFTDTIMVFVSFSILISFLICFWAEPLSKLLAPGLEVEETTNLAFFLRLFAFSLACIAVGNICTAILNAEKDFLPGKCVGLIQSFCVIVVCFFTHKTLGILSLIFSILLFFILQDIFLLLRVKKYVWFKRGNYFRNQKTYELIKLCIPLFLSNSVIQLNAVIDKAIASSLGEGNVSALSYGHFVFNSIHSILVMNICTVLLTYFSSYLGSNKTENMINDFRVSITMLTYVMAGITALCICESEYIVRLLYQRGAFSENSVYLTNEALIGYAFGIVFVAIRDLIMQVLYALKKNTMAMVNGMIGVLLNVGLSIQFASKMGIFGIAIADGAAYLFVAMLSFFEIKSVLNNIWNVRVLKELASSICCAILCILLMQHVKMHLTFSIYINLFLECILICISYLVFSYLLHSESQKQLFSLFSRYLRRT